MLTQTPDGHFRVDDVGGIAQSTFCALVRAQAPDTPTHLAEGLRSPGLQVHSMQHEAHLMSQVAFAIAQHAQRQQHALEGEGRALMQELNVSGLWTQDKAIRALAEVVVVILRRGVCLV